MTQEEKYRQMTQPPVEGLIAKLAAPCIVSMLVSSFYNMADTYFVGMLNDTAATGAVGVIFSMMAIIQAIGFFFGHGSGNYISRCLGRRDVEEASTMASTGFFYAISAGVILCIIGQIFLEPIARGLGSTATILPHSKAYLQVILLGAPWMIGSFVLNNQLRFQGSAAYAMIGITSGAVLNIALDPLLILVFHMGVAGAGWATIISQFVSFLILLAGSYRGSNIPIRFSNVKFRLWYLRNIVRGGLPSLARQGLASVAGIALNWTAGVYGDAAIAAMGVVQRITNFGQSAMIGFGQGFQPFCGFNYGARKYARVKKGFWFCVRVSFVFLVLVCIAGWIFAGPLVTCFRDDPDVISFGAMALRLQCLTFWIQSFVVMSNMMDQVMGKTVPATFLAMARQGIFFIPAVLLLPVPLGALGVQLAQPVADVLSLASAIPIQKKVLSSLPDEDVPDVTEEVCTST